MSTYEAISLMILFSMFILSLISYIDRNKNQKQIAKIYDFVQVAFTECKK
ncbi:putative holin-like toxin [Natronincola ferrireducens]|nr:putative holin-like toxin [Natronincola ferrireducens]